MTKSQNKQSHIGMKSMMIGRFNYEQELTDTGKGTRSIHIGKSKL